MVARRRAQMMDLVFAVRELLREGKSIAQVADAILDDPGFDLVATPRGMVIEEWYRFYHPQETP
jgi:hypothetical protein